jgi:hypothetical protein
MIGRCVVSLGRSGTTLTLLSVSDGTPDWTGNHCPRLGVAAHREREAASDAMEAQP